MIGDLGGLRSGPLGSGGAERLKGSLEGPLPTASG